jgi:hypothetical protein
MANFIDMDKFGELTTNFLDWLLTDSSQEQHDITAVLPMGGSRWIMLANGLITFGCLVKKGLNKEMVDVLYIDPTGKTTFADTWDKTRTTIAFAKVLSGKQTTKQIRNLAASLGRKEKKQ